MAVDELQIPHQQAAESPLLARYCLKRKSLKCCGQGPHCEEAIMLETPERGRKTGSIRQKESDSRVAHITLPYEYQPFPRPPAERTWALLLANVLFKL